MLNQLNKLLLMDLLAETWQFNILKHNTDVQWGLCAGNILPMPDAEAEQSVKITVPKPNFDFDLPSSKTMSKRKLSTVVPESNKIGSINLTTAVTVPITNP